MYTMAHNIEIIGEDGKTYQAEVTTPTQIWGDSSGGGRKEGCKTINTIDNWPVEYVSKGKCRIQHPDGHWIKGTSDYFT